MNSHIMNVEKEPRNQIYNEHDHDNNDHNHEDTYWEYFLETKDEPTSTYQDDHEAECINVSVSEQQSPLQSKHAPEEATRNVCPLPNSSGDRMSPSDLVVKRHSAPCQNSKQSSLYSNWNYYYHLPNDKNWNLASYKFIMTDINTLEKLIAVNETVTNNIIKNCMLFMMREGVTPMWEDNCNRNGGCFSYKVSNKVVVNVWRELTYLLCCNSLTIDKTHMKLVNGITISPKRGFCIVKIWLKNCSLQDPNIVVDIDNLVKVGCLFKTHKAEF